MKLFVIFALVAVCLLGLGSYCEAGRCDIVCLTDYSPVCAGWGRERKTFGNDCDLKVANCRSTKKMKKLKNGSC